MKSAPSLYHWIITTATTAVFTTVLSHPAMMPEPIRRHVGAAVDEAARAWLVSWGEPTDLLDDPDAPWGVDLGRAPDLESDPTLSGH